MWQPSTVTGTKFFEVYSAWSPRDVADGISRKELSLSG